MRASTAHQRYFTYGTICLALFLLRWAVSGFDDKENSLKLWKTLDPDSRTLIYQLRKLAEMDGNLNSEDEDFRFKIIT